LSAFARLCSPEASNPRRLALYLSLSALLLSSRIVHFIYHGLVRHAFTHIDVDQYDNQPG